MTLILTYISPDLIVQVSDRRLSQQIGKDKFRVVDDESNKAIVFESRFAFSYTGPAEICGKNSDIYFGEKLFEQKDKNISERLRIIRDFLDVDTKTINKKYRALAFVGAGFAFDENGNDIVCYMHLSNFLDSSGDVSFVDDRFYSQIIVLNKPKLFNFFAAGAKIGENHRRKILSELRSANKKSATANSISRILVENLLKISSFNDTVGDSLMISILPKRSIDKMTEQGQSYFSIGINLMPNEVSCFYWKPGQDCGIRYAPIIVSNGQIISNIYMSFGTESQPAQPHPSIAEIHFQGPDGSKTLPFSYCPCGSGNIYATCHGRLPDPS